MQDNTTTIYECTHNEQLPLQMHFTNMHKYISQMIWGTNAMQQWMGKTKGEICAEMENKQK